MVWFSCIFLKSWNQTGCNEYRMKMWFQIITWFANNIMYTVLYLHPTISSFSPVLITFYIHILGKVCFGDACVCSSHGLGLKATLLLWDPPQYPVLTKHTKRGDWWHFFPNCHFLTVLLFWNGIYFFPNSCRIKQTAFNIFEFDLYFFAVYM